MPGENVATLQLDELTIAYEMEGIGVPLVFLHQVATDRQLWRHQSAYFRSHYCPIVVDILGHGQSAWPPQLLSIEHAAQRLQQFLERLGTGPVFMIGVSMGAAVAVRVALQAPTLVRGLGLISPWEYIGGDMQSLVNRLFRLAESGDMAAHVELFLRYIFPIEFATRHPEEAERVRTLMLEQQAAAVAYTWVACLATDLRHQLCRIGAPSLVIAGLNDLFAPPYLARGVAERLSEVELEIWEDTGHFPFLEDPRRFNRRLEVFIQRCLARSNPLS
jgi:pimeloyl-ACP methyl ester carboxylesterase